VRTTEKEGRVNVMYVLSFILAVVLLVYLLVALFFPEKF
jgi:K+-transporting ATPase KdpF subunit